MGVDSDNRAVKDFRLVIHTIVQRVIRDYQRQQFNTVVAAAMELTNAAEKADWSAMGDEAERVMSEVAYVLINILAPVTPHVCEKLWAEFEPKRRLGEDGWLKFDEQALVKNQMTYVVQVNGKLRAKIEVSATATKPEIEEAAQNHENVQRFIEGLTVRKVIVIPNKLVNIVAN